ncbi:MAG: hypothetical protein Q9200_005588 [Gallowayella weberi]
MAPFNPATLLSRPKPERQLLILRSLQITIGITYIILIAATSANTGRWTYDSIATSATLGDHPPIATAATLTLLNFAVYLTRFDLPLRPAAAGSGRLKRISHLVLRIVVDLMIATLWGAAFAMSFRRKMVNFQNLFAKPPYGTWVPAVVFTLVEWY